MPVRCWVSIVRCLDDPMTRQSMYSPCLASTMTRPKYPSSSATLCLRSLCEFTLPSVVCDIGASVVERLRMTVRLEVLRLLLLHVAVPVPVIESGRDGGLNCGGMAEAG